MFVIEQIAERGLREPVLNSLKRRPDANACPRVVIEMEEHRCKIAAAGMEDPRCQSLLDGLVVEMEDQRCKSLRTRLTIEIEDRRSNSVAIRMEDPRCSNLHNRW